jgi:hypothetical protein
MQQREGKARIRAFMSFTLGDFAFFALDFLYVPCSCSPSHSRSRKFEKAPISENRNVPMKFLENDLYLQRHAGRYDDDHLASYWLAIFIADLFLFAD